jgi:multidrug resistance efflux pump
MNRLPAALLRSLATIAIVVAAVLVGIWMWNYYERSPWTRDGRVRADVVRVTPDISGLVTSVEVRDNQRVNAGDLLFVIDTPRYALALEQANARIASAQAALTQAQREARRDTALGNLVAAETHEQNLARVETARAQLAEVMSARDVAALNLKRTRVLASVNGVVTNLDLHPGDFVGAGSQAMALVDSDSVRIEGYFEETKLPMICIGAPVTVRLMGETQDVHGHVESISYGIDDNSRGVGSNLLPSVEPNFSWVRLAQRIPVRVKIDKAPADMRLITGRTATVTIRPAREDAKPGECRHV